MVPDSSVICAYLEKKHPSPALYPADPAEFARALFLEEYADTRMFEVLSGILFERVVKPYALQQPPDEARVAELCSSARCRRCWTTSRAQLPEDGDTLLARFSIADAALGAQLGSLTLSSIEIDAGRWPRIRALLPGAARAPLVQDGAWRASSPRRGGSHAIRTALLPPPGHGRSRRRSATEPSGDARRRCGPGRRSSSAPACSAPRWGSRGVEAATSLRRRGRRRARQRRPLRRDQGDSRRARRHRVRRSRRGARAGRGAAPSCGSGPSRCGRRGAPLARERRELRVVDVRTWSPTRAARRSQRSCAARPAWCWRR